MELREYGSIGESVYAGRLPNGLSVFVVPKPLYSKRYAFFATNYGGADRRFKYGGEWLDTPEGVAHFLEHKMFDTETGNALTELSANGASPNAFTATDITAYHFESTEKFEENLKTLLSFVSVPYFTPESVEKEQGIIAQEIKMVEDDPDYAAYYGLMKSLYKSNPVRESVAGTVESIREITAETLYKCHKVFYNPSNMALCVAGDVPPEQVLDIAAELLPKDAGEIPERDYGPTEGLQPEKGSVAKKMEVGMPIMLIGCKAALPESDAKYLKRELIGSLALELLAGSSSPLFLRLYSEGLITGDFGGSFDIAAGAAFAVLGGETRDPDRVFDEVRREARLLAEQGPDNALFDRLKKAAFGRQIRALNSFSSICYNYVNGYFRGYDALTAPDVLRDVTPEDVAAFFRESTDNMAISVVLPKQDAAAN